MYRRHFYLPILGALLTDKCRLVMTLINLSPDRTQVSGAFIILGHHAYHRYEFTRLNPVDGSSFTDKHSEPESTINFIKDLFYYLSEFSINQYFRCPRKCCGRRRSWWAPGPFHTLWIALWLLSMEEASFSRQRDSVISN